MDETKKKTAVEAGTEIHAAIEASLRAEDDIARALEHGRMTFAEADEARLRAGDIYDSRTWAAWDRKLATEAPVSPPLSEDWRTPEAILADLGAIAEQVSKNADKRPPSKIYDPSKVSFAFARSPDFRGRSSAMIMIDLPITSEHHVPSVDIEGFVIDGISVALSQDHERNTVRIVCETEIRDLRTGRRDRLLSPRVIGGEYLTPVSRPVLLEEIKRAIMDALEHEVDERLRVDGELVTDPHPELRARPGSPR